MTVGGPVVYSLKRIVGLSHFLCAFNILRWNSEVVAYRILFVDLSTKKFIVCQAIPVPSTRPFYPSLSPRPASWLSLLISFCLRE